MSGVRGSVSDELGCRCEGGENKRTAASPPAPADVALLRAEAGRLSEEAQLALSRVLATSVERPPAGAGQHFVWPVITEKMRLAVMGELDKDVTKSAEKGGISDEFEGAWAQYHGLNHAVVANSGTSALYAAFFSLNLEVGSQVIVPSWTFFATSSTLGVLGLVPVFVDAGEDGNIDPEDICRNIVTGKTKAVAVTHMWGVPCQMDRIADICKAQGLKLVEDCSHAHGARYRGRLVGTFGDVAAWSLHGKKLVAGGEGGVLAMSDRDVFERAVVALHINHRPKRELSAQSPLRPYALTGSGMNLRPSPFNIAMAHAMFEGGAGLDSILRQKRAYAQRFISALRDISFLRMPVFDPAAQEPSWYAFVMNFLPDRAPSKLSRNALVELLHSEYGLTEVEYPGSTCPNHTLAIFRAPSGVHPSRASVREASAAACETAEWHSRTAIKLPMWFLPEHDGVVQMYINGIRNAAHRLTSGA